MANYHKKHRAQLKKILNKLYGVNSCILKQKTKNITNLIEKDKNYIKKRIASINLSLNFIQFQTMFLCDNWLNEKKIN